MYGFPFFNFCDSFHYLKYFLALDDAKNLFESDRNKHIQLLLGGVSSTELENFQSEKSSLEICEVLIRFICVFFFFKNVFVIQISDDNESLCTRSCVEASATPVSEEANDASNESFFASQPDSRAVLFGNEKPRSQEETSTPCAGSVSGNKSSEPKNSEHNYDFSILDAQMPRYFEVPFTPPTRNLKVMDRMEFERRLMSENELLREEKQSTIRSKSSCGDSEIEDSHRSTVMEMDDAVSELGGLLSLLHSNQLCDCDTALVLFFYILVVFFIQAITCIILVHNSLQMK